MTRSLFFGLLFLSRGLFAITPEPAQQTSETITVYGRRPLVRPPHERTELEAEVLPKAAEWEHSVGNYLRRAGSVEVRETGGEGSTPSLFIRGQDPRQTRYFLEEIPLTDAQFNTGNLSFVPLDVISQVDIYPQGTPAYLAEDGLGGALDFRLNLGEKDPSFIAPRFGSYALIGTQGHVTIRQPLLANVSLNYVQANEDYVYFDNNGTPFNSTDDQLSVRKNNFFRRASLLPQAVLYLDRIHDLRCFSLNGYGETQIPGPVSMPVQADLQEFFQLTALKYRGKWAKDIEARFQIFSRLDLQNLKNKSLLSAPLLPDSDSRSLALGTKFRGRFSFGEKNEAEAITGATWERYLIHTTNLLQDAAERERVLLPLGASAIVPIAGPLLTAKGGVLAHLAFYSTLGSSDESLGRNFFLFSPRFSLSSELGSGVSVQSSVGRYARAPSLYELYGTAVGISANPDLESEQADRADFGLQWQARVPSFKLRSVVLSYNAYLSRANNLVTFVENAQNSRVAVNIGDSYTVGHELGAEVKSQWDLVFRVRANLMDARNLSNIPYENDKQLPNRPSYRTRWEVSYEREKFSAGYAMTLWGPSYWDVANLKQLSSVSDHGAFISWSPKGFGSFFLEARNLMDQLAASSQFGTDTVVDNTSGYVGYPAPGRRIYFSWRIEI